MSLFFLLFQNIISKNDDGTAKAVPSSFLANKNYSSIAVIPGNILPSQYSSIAPPAVEI